MKKNLGYLLLVLLLAGCSSDGNNSLNDSYTDIEKTMESARLRSVEAYADAIESAIYTYVLSSGSNEKITICAKDGNVPNTCVIDASPSAQTNMTKQGKKAVTYSGRTISCESIKYDEKNKNIVLTNCTVGDYLDAKYSGDMINGFSRV